MGIVCCAGNCGGENPRRFPAHSVIVLAAAVLVAGNDGTEVSTLWKLNAVVMSPTADRRHAERFGTSAPNRVSRNRSNEVWSNTSDDTSPPRVNGDTMIIGTRNPSPIGPVTSGVPPSDGSGTGGAVKYSPGVPGGAVGGGT